MPQWLEAMTAEDLELTVAGNHFALTQSMDEESTQTVNFTGAFGSNKAVARMVRQGDADTLSFSALLLKPGQNAGMDNEDFMRSLKDFTTACKRGAAGRPQDWHVYKNCAWTRIHVASTLDSVTLTGDFSGFLAS